MDGDRPVLRIARGSATTEELAALVTVLMAVGSAAAASLSGAGGRPTPVRAAWADPVARLGRTAPLGPGGWRASGLPR
ncbi:MAG: acyl-CoA carboxylase subunit epsilon [Actinobacteria bacterium]|nr:acyl-CoA carboxylase subunit epsilon [Actinomycetota bacterium]MBI3687887.1 acyl-CoA carboxylase subunit epsilon [Actinomycetota bacterium]